MFQKLSYQYKLYITFAIIFFVALFLSGIFFYHYNAALIHDNLEQSSMESLIVIHTRIDDCLEKMDDIIKNIHASTEFTDIAFHIPEQQNNYFTKKPRIKARLNNIFLSSLISENLSTNINFVSRYYDYIGTYMKISPYSKAVLSKKQISEINYVNEGMITKEYRIFIPPHVNEWLAEGQRVFSVVRPVRDNFYTYGILVINQDTEELEKLCTIKDMKEEYSIAILNEAGKLVFETDDTGLMKQSGYEGKIQNDQGYWYSSKNILYCYHKSELTGWTLIMQRNLAGYNQKIEALRHMVFLCYFAGFVIILIFLYIITKSLTKPLKQLRYNLSNLQADKEIHIEVPSNSNEVTVLAVAIEEILNKIKQQNDMIILERKRALKAHVDVLDAQMNPHFLYNALSVIGACGYEDGSERVNRMCRELANLLRYSIKYEHRQVLLSEEIQNIRDYLSIMQMRYEDNMDVVWELEDRLNNIRVPKLVLQPIIENCFKHGFHNQPPIWRISVKSVRNNNSWRIMIKNNGVPFDQDQITALKENYEHFKETVTGHKLEDESDRKGVGLENTLKRLYIQYGEEAYYNITEEAGWSVVEIGGCIEDGQL
jgi:Predicted signal transduction protein with a C-terminal ATPase domain